MKVGELIEQLKGLEDYDLVIEISKVVSMEELDKRQCKYPYDVYRTEDIDFGDVGESKVYLDCLVL